MDPVCQNRQFADQRQIGFYNMFPIDDERKEIAYILTSTNFTEKIYILKEVRTL